MRRAPGAEEHAGTPPDSRRALAAANHPGAPGRGTPPAPPRTHRAPRPRPSGPPACSARRRRRRRLSRGGHGQGEGRGSTPGRARKGPVLPPGGAVGRGKRAWRGRCGAGPAGSRTRRGLGLSRGLSRLQGVGWQGRPGSQRRSINRRRTRSRQEAQWGGRDEVGAGPPGNPSLSGPRCSERGRGQPADPRAPTGPRPPDPSGFPRPWTPWGPRRELWP